MPIRQSVALAVNERLRSLSAAGRPILHLAFGDAGLPVLPELAAVLARSARYNEYGPAAGIPSARAAAAGYFGRRGLATDADHVVLAPGSKALLSALLTILPGDVVVPVPSWVSYAAQAELAGRRVIGVPIPDRTGGVPDPELLITALAGARAAGASPGVLIVTVPDNPTGTVAPHDVLAEVCRIADREGLVVIADEIYRDLCRCPAELRSPAEFLPDRTIVSTGLSKNLALGGYRIGFARLPTSALGARILRDLVSVASELWSNLASPMQYVAAAALDEPAAVTERIEASRRLHNAVTAGVHELCAATGIACRPPGGGFYLYPDFGPLRDRLAGRGVRTAQQLAELLLDRYAISVRAGVEFGDDPNALRCRVSTSVLYGRDDEQRLASLRSDRPTELPWIVDALAHLSGALDDIAAPAR